MENQHRKIKGYRELTQEEIDLMNEIKQKGIELDDLVEKLSTYTLDQVPADLRTDSQAQRWISIGKTHLQQGLMALTRAVAKPEFF